MKEIKISNKELLILQKIGNKKVDEFLESVGFDTTKPIDSYEIGMYRYFTQRD